MIYGKLPIVLLSAMASEANGTKECAIAHYILVHRREAAELGIVELAERCHVSVSSISRFCRALGLQNFAELRALLRQNAEQYDVISHAENAEQRATELANLWQKHIARTIASVDMRQIATLCRKIGAYDRVAIFGLLKAGMAAQCLQADLLLQNKVTVCKTLLFQQMEYIEQADEGDLILIFSYSGIYFDYLNQCVPDGMRRAHVVFITGTKERVGNYINQTIRFDSDLSQTAHPVQMELISALIAQEYAHFMRAQKAEE